jgi:Reverse transcriptase (RNA-dependent DNA polymerase)
LTHALHALRNARIHMDRRAASSGDAAESDGERAAAAEALRDAEQNLKNADASHKAELKRAQRAHARKQADKLNSAWEHHPHSRMAHARLQSMTKGPGHDNTVHTVRAPDTGEECKEPADKCAAFRTLYSRLATPHTSRHPSAAAQRAEIQAAIVAAVADGDALTPPPQNRGVAAGEEGGGTEDRARPDLNEPISETELTEALRRLKNCKAAGGDGVVNELLKYSVPAGKRMLLTLFNLVWQCEDVPVNWRQGRIINLHKGGDATECSNYRPITLLHVIDKLFCSILTARMSATVPLHAHQYAFRRGRGTLQPLFAATGIVASRKHQGLRTYAFFLDVKKAYDTVPHEALLYKLLQKGVTGKIWRVIKAMYSMRPARLPSMAPCRSPSRSAKGWPKDARCPPCCMLCTLTTSFRTFTKSVRTMASISAHRTPQHMRTWAKVMPTTCCAWPGLPLASSASSMWCGSTA